MPTCIHCGQEKHELEFQSYPNARLNAWCRECMVSRVRAGRRRSGRNQATWLNWERKRRHQQEEEQKLR